MSNLDFHVTIPEEHVKDLQLFMDLFLQPFDPRGQVSAISVGPPSNFLITGASVRDAIREINSHLESRRLSPGIPDESNHWSLGRMHRFMVFALRSGPMRGGAAKCRPYSRSSAPRAPQPG